MKTFAYGLIFFILAWGSSQTQASCVSTKIGTTISFSKISTAALLAQDPTTSTSSQTGEGGGGGGMEKIQKAIYSGSVGEDGGVLGVGLSWLRGLTIMFLGLYGIYLGISLAFGQADGAAIARLFFGAMMALGAQTVSTLYTVIFTGEGG